MVATGLAWPAGVFPALVRLADFGGIWKVEVLAARAAHLDVQLVHRSAARAAPLRLELLGAVQDHGDQPEQRQHGADGEPDEERAALRPADDRGRDPERECNQRVLHAPILALRSRLVDGAVGSAVRVLLRAQRAGMADRAYLGRVATKRQPDGPVDDG